jgi:predicted transcriptional regulator
LNTKLMDKAEELKNQLIKIKKQYAQEIQDKVKEALREHRDQEQEIIVLKEMIKGVKFEVKSKDTDI